MQKQYKLYIFDMKDIDDTKNSLYKIINKSRCKYINSCVVAIEYDYLNNEYKELLESLADLKLSQYIVTTSKFYNMLTMFVKMNLRVYDIKLNSLFMQDNDVISKYISLIRADKEKDENLNLLLEELRWYNYDEGIDINNMSFGILGDEIIQRFSIYNNGVLNIDSEEAETKVLKILESVL